MPESEHFQITRPLDHSKQGDRSVDQGLAMADPEVARVVELRPFSRLEQIATYCGISRATAARQWRFARTGLATRLQIGGNV